MTRATLFSLLVLVGCGAPQPTMIEPPVEAVEEPQVARAGVDGPWILERGSLDGASIPLPAGTRTMIDIDGEQLGLSAACNTYGAEIREAPFGLEVAVGAGTAMDCEDERGASESAVVEAVDRVTVIARTEAPS